MPKATFRSFVGIARETGRSVTTTAIGAPTATTIVLADATGFANTNKVTIYDGASTETVTISGVSGNTLTVSATTLAHTTNGLLVTTLGTASTAPTDYIPVTKFDPQDTVTFLEDKGWRGSMVELYDLISGPRESSIDLAGDVFPDTVGYFLGGLLGDVLFTGGTPNTHTFSTKNSTDGQPTSYQITDYYGVLARQYGGVQFSEFGLKATGDGLLTYDVKAAGYASGSNATFIPTPTPSFSAVRAHPGYVGAVTLQGASTVTLASFDLTIKRATDAIHTIDGGPDPYRVWDGAVSVEGKATYVMEDDTFLGYYLNNTQPSLAISWSLGSGASQVALTVQMTKAAHKLGKVNRGKAYVALDIDLEGVGNTTDGGVSAGYSPIKLTTKNTKATGTFG